MGTLIFFGPKNSQASIRTTFSRVAPEAIRFCGVQTNLAVEIGVCEALLTTRERLDVTRDVTYNF